MSEIEPLPKIYRYDSGRYDDPDYFTDKDTGYGEEAEDSSEWCRAFDVIATYQLMKERIVELEADLQIERSLRDKYENDLEYYWKTRVPDDLLVDIISCAYNGCAIYSPLEYRAMSRRVMNSAQAILDKRKENQ